MSTANIIGMEPQYSDTGEVVGGLAGGVIGGLTGPEGAVAGAELGGEIGGAIDKTVPTGVIVTFSVHGGGTRSYLYEGREAAVAIMAGADPAGFFGEQV